MFEGFFLFVVWKVVRSDTDCEGASESDTPTVQTSAKKTKSTPSSAVSVEEQCSDRDEQNNKYQNISGSINHWSLQIIIINSCRITHCTYSVAKQFNCTRHKFHLIYTRFNSLLPSNLN